MIIHPFSFSNILHNEIVVKKNIIITVIVSFLTEGGGIVEITVKGGL